MTAPLTLADALALRAAHNAAPPTLTPWEVNVEDEGEDVYIIAAPEAAITEIARLYDAEEGAGTDARYIARAVNAHVALFETVIALHQELARLREHAASDNLATRCGGPVCADPGCPVHRPRALAEDEATFATT